MNPPQTVKLPAMAALRFLLVLDSALLTCLGACLIFIPARVEEVFHFHNLPAGVGYMIGLWGCVLITMALGYFIAASDPLRHVIWIQVGIARGALECLLGVVYLARGVVTLQQAGLGIVVAAGMTGAYLLLYPRVPRLNSPPATEIPKSPGMP